MFVLLLTKISKYLTFSTTNVTAALFSMREIEVRRLQNIDILIFRRLKCTLNIIP